MSRTQEGYVPDTANIKTILILSVIEENLVFKNK